MINKLAIISNSKPLNNCYELVNLNEDIHWILLVSGFIIFEINSDSVRLISNEIMQYSLKWNGFVDDNLVKCLLFALSQKGNSLGLTSSTETNMTIIDTNLISSSGQFDPIIGLFFNAFELSELENHMYNLNPQYVSPQVSVTLIWYLKEMVHSYLFLQENSYEELSTTFQILFGIDTDSGTTIVQFLLRKIINNFSKWSSENDVTDQTAKLLLEMVKNKNVNKILIEHKEFWSLSKMTSLNEVSCLNLSLNVRKMIIKSLVISLSNTCLDSQSFHDYFFESLLKPIEERFERLDSLKSVNAHNENYIKETVNLIETFNGIVGGASLSVITNLVPFILPRLKQGVKLLNLYHNYAEIVELILKMFFVVIENVLVHDDHIISGEIKNQIFKSFLDLIQVFSQQYSGI